MAGVNVGDSSSPKNWKQEAIPIIRRNNMAVAMIKQRRYCEAKELLTSALIDLQPQVQGIPLLSSSSTHVPQSSGTGTGTGTGATDVEAVSLSEWMLPPSDDDQGTMYPNIAQD